MLTTLAKLVTLGAGLGGAFAVGVAATSRAPRPHAERAPAAVIARAPSGPSASAQEGPTLVVFITIDQLRADYLPRFYPQLTGGLKRLYDGGAVFTDAHQDHATTETAPGHASTLSGRFPAGTGIVRNNAGVNDRNSPLLGSEVLGASPFRFRGTVLADWMRGRDGRTRVLSVSRKDRSAILPAGRGKGEAHQVYWYVPNDGGSFTTSRYYADTLPAWVRRFNARGGGVAAAYAGRAWAPLLADSAYPERDSVPAEGGGGAYAFPYTLAAEADRAAQELPAFPWSDDATAAIALEGVTAMSLGTGPHADLLAVSFSATDAVGHRFGPDSRELHDQVLRVDRMLGAFMDSVYALRDSARVVFALTADHGVAPLPEVHFPGADPRRGRLDAEPVIAAHRQRLAARGVAPAALDFEYGMLFVDRAALKGARVDADSALRALAADLRAVPGVARVDLRAELAGKPDADTVARRWRHALPDDLPVGLVVTQRPFYYWTEFARWDGSTYATHGSPHDYDTHVPVIFYGPPFRAGKYKEFARVVDMAPTLAHALGVSPTEKLDGVVLRSAIR